MTTWTEDKCTCGHPVSKHINGEGRCVACDGENRWSSNGIKLCNRFQWDEEPRKKTW